MAHDDRRDFDDSYRPRRYGSDEEYERDFWQDREARDRGRYRDSPGRRYESTPVLGMDLGDSRENRGAWGHFNERQEGSNPGYSRDTDWSNTRGERGWWDRTRDEVRSWMGDTDAEHRREADYRGRGPRGYTRSDERIREEVSDWLMEDRYVDASEIDVTVAAGEVTLAGTVDSREMKRRAENIAASALGVKDVHNSLRVRRGSSVGSRADETASSVSGASSTGPEAAGSKSPTEPRH
jgi:osmotically-inducible protein OsmY